MDCYSYLGGDCFSIVIVSMVGLIRCVHSIRLLAAPPEWDRDNCSDLYRFRELDKLFCCKPKLYVLLMYL